MKCRVCNRTGELKYAVQAWDEPDSPTPTCDYCNGTGSYWKHAWNEVKSGWKSAEWSWHLLVILLPLCIITAWVNILYTHEVPDNEVGGFIATGIFYLITLLNGIGIHRAFLWWK